jgi:hypothetical protein
VISLFFIVLSYLLLLIFLFHAYSFVYLMGKGPLSDWTTGVNTAFEKGRSEDMKERNIAIVRHALGHRLTVDVIEDLTGLSAEDIIKL